jgi:hypothetical protein
MVMMIALAAAVHAVSSVSIATSSKSAYTPSNSFITAVSTVATIATQAVVASVMTNVTHIKHNNYETASVLKYKNDVNNAYLKYEKEVKAYNLVANIKASVQNDTPLDKSFIGVSDCNPLLPAPYSILRQVGVTVEEAKALLAELLARGWECCKEMPHKSNMTARRKDEEMHIDFPDHLKNFIPPAKTYRTPIHLLPKLEKFLKELLELGIIRKSTSP